MKDHQRQANEALFKQLAEELLTDPDVSRSTMMGYPCLRFRGAYFACISRDSAQLIVKLPAETVAELIATGEALPFAPNGRTFREWVELHNTDANRSRSLVAQAKAFVT